MPSLPNMPDDVRMNDRRAPWLQEDDEPLWVCAYEVAAEEFRLYGNIASPPEDENQAVEWLCHVINASLDALVEIDAPLYKIKELLKWKM